MRRTAIVALLVIVGATASHANDLDEPDCAHAADTQTTTICAANDLADADAELNTVYQRALADQAAFDKARKEGGESDAEAAKSLKAAERAWIAFRDANCESLNAGNIGGTGYSAFIVECQMTMTRDRIKELKSLIGEGN